MNVSVLKDKSKQCLCFDCGLPQPRDESLEMYKFYVSEGAILTPTRRIAAVFYYQYWGVAHCLQKGNLLSSPGEKQYPLLLSGEVESTPLDTQRRSLDSWNILDD